MSLPLPLAIALYFYFFSFSSNVTLDFGNFLVLQETTLTDANTVEIPSLLVMILFDFLGCKCILTNLSIMFSRTCACLILFDRRNSVQYPFYEDTDIGSDESDDVTVFNVSSA